MSRYKDRRHNGGLDSFYYPDQPSGASRVHTPTPIIAPPPPGWIGLPRTKSEPHKPLERDLLGIKGSYDVALTLAISAHMGQKDKAGKPYIHHPLRVAQRLEQLGYSETVQIVGLLHDAVEDGGLTEHTMVQAMGELVASNVMLLTREEGITYESFIQNIRKGSEIARAVKIADVEDNYNRLNQLTDERERTGLAKRYTRALQVLCG